MTDQRSTRQTLHYLRAWRLERLLTLRELAERSGVTVTTIHALERLQGQANMLTVAKLARGLGISREALLHQSPEQSALEALPERSEKNTTEAEGERRAIA